MRTSDFIIGLGLVILGLLFLLENFGYIEFNFGDIWPVFVVLGGVGFWLGFLKDRKNFGLVMPGTILIAYGLLFWYCSVQGWYYMQDLWPVFLLGPGIGFFLMYFLGERERGLLVPGSILSGLGILFLFRYSMYLRYWPVLLIIFGAVLIFRHLIQEKKTNI
jgi:hypothetical protein